MAKKISMLVLLSGITVLCMSLMVNAAEIDNDAEKYEAGQYKVGTDIPADEYVIFAENYDTEGYFCVSTDSNQNDIIENENFSYNSILTVYDGEYLELERCSAVPFDEVISLDTSGSGMFKVGVHLPAGEYKLDTNGSESGYYCIYDDSGDRNIISNNNFDNSTYVTVEDGQYLLLTRCNIDDEYLAPLDNDAPENKTSYLRIEIESFEAIDISEDSWTVECIVKNNAEVDLRYISLSAFVCNEEGGRMNASNSVYEDIIAPGQTVSMIFSGSESNPAYLQLYNYFYTDINEVSDHGEFSENDAIKVELTGKGNEEEQYQETEPIVEATVETDASDFLYVQNDGEVHIKSYVGTSPNVSIPNEIDGGVVTTIENEAFSENEDIQSVTFPSSINSIGDNAFFNCVNLKTVEFPVEKTDYLTIGSSAFSYCNISGEIIINAHTLEIGYWAFSGNSDLSDFIILSDEIRFEDSVFSYCSSLESVYMKPSASAIYVGAFGNSNEGDVFANLSSLKAVFLPRECDFLTEYTFENSPSVVIYVPEDSGIVDYATELWLPVNTSDYDEETTAILDRVSALGYDLSENEVVEYEKDETETMAHVPEETESEQEIETEPVISEMVETEAEVMEETYSETPTEEETEDLSADSFDETPLTRSDFFITIINGENEEFDEDDKELMLFDNDALSYLDSLYPDGGGVLYIYSVGSKDIDGVEIPDESASEWQTYRGIGTDGSTKNDVISAYGIGLDLLYDQNSDPLYESFSYYADPYIIRLFEDYAKEVLVYTYKNLYQIAFYIDDTDEVLSIFYINSVDFEADAATILSVQKSLDILGYDCGATDGIVGTKTTAAIKKYQDDNGLFVSGIIDDELLKSLYDQGAITLGNDLKISADINDEVALAEPTESVTEALTKDQNEAPTESQTESQTEVATEEASNETLSDLTLDDTIIGVPVATFVERYSEAISEYNLYANANGEKTGNNITEEHVLSGDLLSPDDALDIALNHESSEIGDYIGEFMVWGAADTDIALGELYALIYALDTSLSDVKESSKLCNKIFSAFELEYHDISYSFVGASDFITFTAKINDYKPVKESESEEVYEANEDAGTDLDLNVDAATEQGTEYSALMEYYLEYVTGDSNTWSYIGPNSSIPEPDSCLKNINSKSIDSNSYFYILTDQNEESLNEMAAAYGLVLTLDCGFTLDSIEGVSDSIDGIYSNGNLIGMVAKGVDPSMGYYLGVAVAE